MTTTTRQDIDLMAHLMRRAAFGAPLTELEQRAAKGYEETVEELLNPGDPKDLSQDTIRRYHVDQSELRQMNSAAGNWLYRMITTKNPLEERVALFYHSLFATGYAKLNQARSLLNQIDMFRIHGLGRFDTILIELSKDPAMLLWLDNNENHNGHINENYGRELLELFSMGIGNYTEDDIKEASRAFTGWTLGNVEYMAMRAMKDSIWPYSRIAWHYQYRATTTTRAKRRSSARRATSTARTSSPSSAGSVRRRSSSARGSSNSSPPTMWTMTVELPSRR